MYYVNSSIDGFFNATFAHVQTGPGAHPASCTMGTFPTTVLKHIARYGSYADGNIYK
jgi:hypothetical protein